MARGFSLAPATPVAEVDPGARCDGGVAAVASSPTGSQGEQRSGVHGDGRLRKDPGCARLADHHAASATYAGRMGRLETELALARQKVADLTSILGISSRQMLPEQDLSAARLDHAPVQRVDRSTQASEVSEHSHQVPLATETCSCDGAERPTRRNRSHFKIFKPASPRAPVQSPRSKCSTPRPPRPPQSPISAEVVSQLPTCDRPSPRQVADGGFSSQRGCSFSRATKSGTRTREATPQGGSTGRGTPCVSCRADKASVSALLRAQEERWPPPHDESPRLVFCSTPAAPMLASAATSETRTGSEQMSSQCNSCAGSCTPSAPLTPRAGATPLCIRVVAPAAPGTSTATCVVRTRLSVTTSVERIAAPSVARSPPRSTHSSPISVASPMAPSPVRHLPPDLQRVSSAQNPASLPFDGQALCRISQRSTSGAAYPLAQGAAGPHPGFAFVPQLQVGCWPSRNGRPVAPLHIPS